MTRAAEHTAAEICFCGSRVAAGRRLDCCRVGRLQRAPAGTDTGAGIGAPPAFKMGCTYMDEHTNVGGRECATARGRTCWCMCDKWVVAVIAAAVANAVVSAATPLLIFLVM